MPTLRPYQLKLYNEIFDSYAKGSKATIAVLPTGGGKTVVISEVLKAFQAPAVAIAHRKELVSQISIALARNGVRHRIIGDSKLARRIAGLHIKLVGRDYTNRNSPIAVAGVDTLINFDSRDPWFASVRFWCIDEGHHVLRENKWGKAAAMFPNAVGLLPTATPMRADKKGLGSHADGIADAMIIGPTMRELMQQGFLTDYRVFAPPSDVDYSDVTITESGDYSLPKLRAAVHRSTKIVGDVVSHYCRLAHGKLGVTFAVDVEAAKELAEGYRMAGVPAEVVSATTPDELRADILRRFERREIWQLCNVDLFGEGFDLPAIEVVSMVRKTKSFSLFCQQMGRALRPLEGKEYAIIIDHVGNFESNLVVHGLPDTKRDWSLDAGERRRTKSLDAEAVRVCDNVMCLAAYPRRLTECPYCSEPPKPALRSAPEFVDGDLHELDLSAFKTLSANKDAVDAYHPKYPYGANAIVRNAVFNRHQERQEAQANLRDSIALWAGYWTHMGESDRVIQKRFFLTWDIDILSAQALGTTEATALRERIDTWLQSNNVKGANLP
jgi:DNA repair protein RadD